MPVAEDIERLIKSAEESPAEFDPAEFVEQARSLLREACSRGGECDSAGPNPIGAQGPYFATADFLFLNNFGWAAEELLFEWWNDVGLRHLEERSHVYRANCAYKLTQLYLRRADRGAAIRWALLTQADDLLSKHGKGGGAGRQWLRTTLGMSQAELDEFSRIAAENLEKVEGEKDHSSNPAWFAEDVVVRLALKDIAFEHLFSQPSSVREFPISPPYLCTLIDQLDTQHGSQKAKGDALENLAAYLFLLVPGWFPLRNVLDENVGFETDIIVSNLNPVSNLTADLLGRHILVECKNWERSVSVGDVGYFLYRMRLTHCSFGVIFAKNNISGEKQGETAARSLIRRAFHEDGNTCIVLDREDLESLANNEITFWSILLRETTRFRFGKPK